MKKNYLLIIVISLIFVISCNDKNSNTGQNKNDTSATNNIYNIIGKNVVVRSGPGENFDKIINKKATEALGETNYCEVDNSFRIIIEETKGEWSKIKVLEPDWLSETHNGWIPTANIQMDSNGAQITEALDKNSYEIIKKVEKKVVTNYYVLIKIENFNEEIVNDFVVKFRREYCSTSSNVNVYDTKSISDLIERYPLEGKEYIKVADHFVAQSSFDSPETILWYPFQDSKYKENGGNNWKKEKIK